MKSKERKKIAIILTIALALSLMPVYSKADASAAARKYSISKKSGTYTTTVEVTVKAMSGYKVYYTRNGKFTTGKIIKSGKSKTFTIKSDSTLQLIVVKKSAKATKKKLNNKWKSKVKTYTYYIKKAESTETPEATTETPTATAQTTYLPVITIPETTTPVATASPMATPPIFPSVSPVASYLPSPAAPTASAFPTPPSDGGGGSGGTPGGNPGGNTGFSTPVVSMPPGGPGEPPSNGGGFGGGTATTVTGLTAIESDTEKPSALTYDESTATAVTLTSDENELTIKNAGTYIVSTEGTVAGKITVKKGLGDVTIVLNGVDLTSSESGDAGVIEVKGAGDDGTTNHVNIIAAAGTTNTLTSSGTGEEETDDNGNATGDMDYPAGILVKKTGTLTIGGTGTLNINSKNGSGIKVKFNNSSTSGEIDTTCANLSDFWNTTLTIQDNPTIRINCYEADAASGSGDKHQDAISSKNSLAVYGGTLILKAGDDGIHAEAMSHIVDGTITVSSSTEALEGARVVIDGGTLNLTSDDDGINAANGDLTSDTNGEDVNIFNITINSGTITVNAEGDGIDSNGNAFITGGTVTVYGPTQGGNGALDVADRTGALLVTGGTLTATSGTTDMAITPMTSGLGFVAFSPSSAISSGTTLKITDSSGSTVSTLTTKKSTKWVLYSGSGITNNATYNLNSGSSTVASATAGQSSTGGMGTPPGMPPSNQR